MKKKLTGIILSLLTAGVVITGCGNTEEPVESVPEAPVEEEVQEEKEEVIIDLSELDGSYEDESGKPEEGFQAAYIEDGTIEIYWVLNNAENIELYWAGSIDKGSVSANDVGYTFVSTNDKSKTGMEFLASSLDTKEFRVEDGKISYDIVELGDPALATLVPSKEDYSSLGLNIEFADMEDLEEVELVDSGYRAFESDEGITVYYAVKLKNPNKDYAILFPRISIVAYDDEGRVVKTEETSVMGIAAGDEISFGNHISYDGKIATKVDISASNGRYSYEKQEGSKIIPVGDLEIADVEEKTESYSRSYTGSIKNNSKTKSKTMMISVVYKKGDELTGGEVSFIKNVNAGATKKFEVLALPNFKEYDSYEVTAIPWE